VKKAREKKGNAGVHMGGEGTLLRVVKLAGLRRNKLHFCFSNYRPAGGNLGFERVQANKHGPL
jgi:hypothetical protein